MTLNLSRWPAVLGLMVLFASLALGQAGSSARLGGQVSDPSGAMMPNVGIDVDEIATGIHRTTKSDPDGHFTIDVLPPGNYRLTATAAGFSKTVISPIALLVNQTATLTVEMKPGVVSEEVNVQSSAVRLDTETSSLGGVVTSNTVAQMPLLLRDPTQLVQLVAGVTADHRQEGATAPGSNLGGLSYQGRLAFEINGGWRSQAVSLVDGVDVTISAGSFLSTPVQPTSDITQEFKVQTTNMSADFGRGAGVLNIVTKSGTNSFHGSAFEFLQNNVLDANNFFSNKAGRDLPHLERNQFGFTVGGPIRKDKTFFFVDSEWLKQANLAAISTAVPTAAQRNGDFSGLFNSAGVPITLYNPYSTFVNGSGQTIRNPFPNNQIPASLITPFAGNILSYYPQPNNPGVLGPNGQYTGVGNYFVSGTQKSNYDRTDVKIDENIGAKHRIMGRYSRDYYTINAVPVFNNAANPTSLSTRNNDQPGNNVVVSWTWTMSPTTVLTQSLNWSRIVDDSNSKSLGFDLSQLGGPFAKGDIAAFANQYTGGTTFPNISMSGYAPLGDGFGQNFREPYSNYQYSAGLLKIFGKHTLNFGFQGILLQAADNLFKGYGGSFSFSGGFSCGPNPLQCTSNTGNALADLLLNTVGGGNMNAAFSSLYSGKYLAGYVQDDFRVSRKLTLNLGLRYDVNTPFTERYDHQFQFNPAVLNPLGAQAGPNTGGASLNSYFQSLVGHPLNGAILFPNSPGSNGRGIAPTDWSNWAPRVGVAYQIKDKLVFRGGFARLYMLSPEAPGPSSPGDGPFGATTNIISTVNGITPNVTLNNPFPNGFQTPLYNSQGLETLVGTAFNVGSSTLGKTPYTYQWNIGFQYQITNDSVVSVAYVGTQAHNLQCPFFTCNDTTDPAVVSQFGSRLSQTVANPFSGIITNPLATLSTPTVQFGQLVKLWPQYAGLTFVLPGYQGLKADTFHNNFNALEIQGTKRTHAGLTLTAAFTWSKNLSNADSPDGGYLGPTAGYQNKYNFAGEYALAASDVPYRLAVGYVYDLPFGKQKKIGSNWSTPVNVILGDWQVAGNTTFAGGYPLPIGQTGQTNGPSAPSSRPNLIGDACYDNGMSRSRNDKITSWLNPAGFAHSANYTQGAAPRTLSCRADGIKNTDLAILKSFSITERLNLQFRSEFFNIFNRTRFGAPNTTFGSSSFGAVTSTLNTPRIIQFGLKLGF